MSRRSSMRRQLATFRWGARMVTPSEWYYLRRMQQLRTALWCVLAFSVLLVVFGGRR